MIVHIFCYEKFVEAYINFINTNFDPKAHRFFVVGSSDKYHVNPLSNKNVLYAKTYQKAILMISELAFSIHKAEKLIIHMHCPRFVFLLGIFTMYLKKTYLSFWGSDIYCLRDNIDKRSLRNNLHIRLKLYQIKKAKSLITLVDGDYELLCSYVAPEGNHFIGYYPNVMEWNSDMLNLQEEIDKDERCGGEIGILVGNNAFCSNQHKEILKSLSAYSDENIRVVVPLSYGDPEYAKEVIAYGEELFGPKLRPLASFMPAGQYARLVAGCSVACFNNNRQQALGNIRLAFKLGLKVYLRSDCCMWDEISRSYRCHDMREVGKVPLGELAGMPEDEAAWNKRAYAGQESAGAIGAWSKIFDD
jgi:hypothetical protein